MHHGMKQQTQRIYEDVALLALDLFARIVAMRIDAGPPFSALFTLWLSMIAAVGVASRSAFSRHATVRDECDPAHHRIATRQNSGAPCCTTESPSADSAIGNRYSGYTSPRPSPPACRSGACHRRAWPAELTVQHAPTRDPSGRLDTSGDHDCISLGSQASTSTASWANQTTSFESKRFSRFKKFRNGHLELAERATSAVEKRRLLRLAERWLDLADRLQERLR